MKRLWQMALLAAFAFAGTATPLVAGCFGMFYWCKGDCSCFCQRPPNAFTPSTCCSGCCYAGCGHNCWTCNPLHTACSNLADCAHSPATHTTLCAVLKQRKHGHLGKGCSDCGDSGSGEIVTNVTPAPAGKPAVAPTSPAPAAPAPSGTPDKPIPIPHPPTPEGPPGKVTPTTLPPAPMVQPVCYQPAAYPGYSYPVVPPMPSMYGYGYYPMYPAPMYHPAYMTPGWYPMGY